MIKLTGGLSNLWPRSNLSTLLKPMYVTAAGPQMLWNTVAGIGEYFALRFGLFAPE
jgi:hypothetical protein